MTIMIKLPLNFVGPRTRSAPEWYGNPVQEIMLLDNGEPSNYGEAMVCPDSDKWLRGHKIRERVHV